MLKFLCLIDTDDRNYYFRRALSRLREEYPGEIDGECFSPGAVRMDPTLRQRLMASAETCDFAVVYFHGGCGNFPGFPELWTAITSHSPCFFASSMPEEIGELAPTSGVETHVYQDMNDYFSRATEENCLNMLLYAANRFFSVGQSAKPFAEIPAAGLFVGGKQLNAEEERQYLSAAGETNKPVVGLMIHRSYVQSGNTLAVEALIRRMEEKGLFVVPVFSTLSADAGDPQSGARYELNRYFCPEGQNILDGIVVTTGFSLTHIGWPDGGEGAFRWSAFEMWDAPVIQAMTTHYTAEQYGRVPQGIDAMSLASNVFQPEMDGQIISVPYAVSEPSVFNGVDRRMWEPIPDRVDHIAEMAKNFAALRCKKNSEKKIAILFHCMPGDQNIGRGAGLDTFASVQKLLVRLKAEGYGVDTLYKDGQELAESLLRALTNDPDWISEEEMSARAAAKVPFEDTKRWYDGLSGKTRDQLKDYWGEVPGTVLIRNGDMLIPGLLNGSVFIGLQPSRAFGEQAERLYHDAVFPPPYSYVGYYRWIREDLGADAVIHVGTHGSVEWLPGKEVGLSSGCWPDICLGSLPNLYIYHMGITGEGIQAKRRSAAVILDHLPPSMDDAGAYDRLADVDAAISEYYAAKRTAVSQVGTLQERVFRLAEEAQLTVDLGLDRESFEAEPEACIEKLHLWMEELKNSAVTDGLHIFGDAPEKGKLFNNMLRMLVRVRNGDVPALNDSVLAAMGYDPETVKDQPGGEIGGRLTSEIYSEAVEHAKVAVETLAEADFAPAAADAVAAWDDWSGDTAPLFRVLRFICETVTPRVEATTDEMENIIRGLSGRFVPPGQGGNPTRGNALLLPTGRNFYAGDPSEIPSVGAWEIGKKLAARSLEQYLEERGEYPESIAMVIWSGNVLKTSGEDFGEIFSLMGVEPVYLGATSKVIGVRAIPIDEVGHPRIDVTLRISGLFRDMYPNLIELMDEAVSCVAALDEPPEMNYIRKHIEEDVAALLENGGDPREAMENAQVRVFGCPAGGYGAGVANLIGNRNWKDFRDLAAVYETWSGNGYGRGHHGEGMQKMFKRRMSSVAMTIKNESTVEIDMLSSDDFFSYHAGLVACVRANAGKTPMVLTGHSDDPDRPLVRSAARETARIVRSRMLNPKWLEGLKRHGFKGAQEVSKTLDSLFGWDAGAEVAEDWMYKGIADTFLLERETREWMQEVNAPALYHVTSKLLEANQRGMWKADEKTLSQLGGILLKTEGLLEEGNP